MASVHPLAALAREVGGDAVAVEFFAERGGRVGDYGDRPQVPPYEPLPALGEPFRNAQFLLVDGRADRWTLAGRGADALGKDAGPVVQLHRLPAVQELLAAGVTGGAFWLDPLTMAQAARDAATRLAVIRPQYAAAFNRRAERLAERLESLLVGVEPRWARVAVISLEPAPLLARVGIEALRLEPAPEEFAPEPERLGAMAREAGAEAILLPVDWAGEAHAQWEARAGLPVVLYDPLGAADRTDPRSDLVALLRFNVEQLTRPVTAPATTEPAQRLGAGNG